MGRSVGGASLAPKLVTRLVDLIGLAQDRPSDTMQGGEILEIPPYRSVAAASPLP
jgi:hypothetical protein